MLTMFSDKRQWQRVNTDTAACEKRRREHVDVVITDKTLLLSLESSEHPNFDENPSNACALSYMDQETELSLQLPWKHDTSNNEPRLFSVDSPDFDGFKHAQMAPLRRSGSQHASWQGFKQLVKKQFMPPFPFRKDMPLKEMQAGHFQQRRTEAAVTVTASRVLGASTNLVELRRLDARIHNGMNKSAFVANSKGGKAKENQAWRNNENLEISKAVSLSSLSEASSNAHGNSTVIKTKPGRNAVMQSSLIKDKGILKKLKRQANKDDMLLLADAKEMPSQAWINTK